MSDLVKLKEYLDKMEPHLGVVNQWGIVTKEMEPFIKMFGILKFGVKETINKYLKRYGKGK